MALDRARVALAARLALRFAFAFTCICVLFVSAVTCRFAYNDPKLLLITAGGGLVIFLIFFLGYFFFFISAFRKMKGGFTVGERALETSADQKAEDRQK